MSLHIIMRIHHHEVTKGAHLHFDTFWVWTVLSISMRGVSLSDPHESPTAHPHGPDGGMAPEGTAATPAAAAVSAPGDDANAPAALLPMDGKKGLSSLFLTQMRGVGPTPADKGLLSLPALHSGASFLILASIHKFTRTVTNPLVRDSGGSVTRNRPLLGITTPPRGESGGVLDRQKGLCGDDGDG